MITCLAPASCQVANIVVTWLVTQMDVSILRLRLNTHPLRRPMLRSAALLHNSAPLPMVVSAVEANVWPSPSWRRMCAATAARRQFVYDWKSVATSVASRRPVTQARRLRKWIPVCASYRPAGAGGARTGRTDRTNRGLQTRQGAEGHRDFRKVCTKISKHRAEKQLILRLARNATSYVVADACTPLPSNDEAEHATRHGGGGSALFCRRIFSAVRVASTPGPGWPPDDANRGNHDQVGQSSRRV